MALDHWNTDNPLSLRLGYTLFDTRTFAESPSTYHVMIVTSTTVDVTMGFRVNIADMAPPLRFGDEPTVRRLHGESYYFGWLHSLNDEDHQQLLAAAHTLRGRAPTADGNSGAYWLATHGVEITDPNDEEGTFTTPHCSCASLVEWCYSKVGVDLVLESSVPHYSANDIHVTFCPYLPNLEEVQRQLEVWGLEGLGPWPLLLPAQQMLAFRDGYPRIASKDDHPWQKE